MAVQLVAYCNRSLGQAVRIEFDDLFYQILSYTILGPCTGGLVPGETIWTAPGSGFKLVAENSIPYANFVAVPPTHEFTVQGPFVSNATLDTASDGIASVTAQGNGVRDFSINGVTYQSSPIFTGLAPGTYTIYSRSNFNGNILQFTTTAVVGFNNADCNTLNINTVNFTHPTTVGGSNGSIVFANAAGLYALEYRLNTGAWQTSNQFLNLPAGVYSAQVRYLLYPSCVKSQSITLNNGPAVNCQLNIVAVTIDAESAPVANNGRIVVSATSPAGGLQYSKNNGASYQASNQFNLLAPGTYQLRVKDANNCEVSQTAVVLAFKPLYVRWPRPNAIRAVITEGPLYEPLQNWDNRLFENMRFPGVTRCRYREPIVRKPQRVQWRSSYDTHILQIFTEANALVATITPGKALDYTQQTNTINNIALADAGGGRAQIIFPNGVPGYLIPGMVVTISGTPHAALNSSFVVEEINTGVLLAEGNMVAIFNVTWPTTNQLVTGNYASVYDIQPFDVWEANINWPSYPVGNYYFVITATDSRFGNTVLRSEPIALADAVADSVQIRYANADDAYEVAYQTGIVFEMNLEAEFKQPLNGGARTVMEDPERRLIKLQEYVTRKPILVVGAIPYFVAERLALALAHDNLLINGVAYAIEDAPEIQHYDHDPLCRFEARLRQVEFMAENNDDAGDVDNPSTVLEVNGVLLRVKP